MNRLDRFERDLDGLHADVVAHRLYKDIETVDELRIFAEHHVFAVWDFMCMLKSLQQQLTNICVPWTPTTWPTAAGRFVNEIVVAEEADVDPEGGFISHFELYLRAMTELGARTAPARRLVAYLRAGCDVDDALDQAGAPGSAVVFVGNTFATIRSGSLPMLVGAFAAGRERLIPEMFTAILAREQVESPSFELYLQRHVEIDGDEHGPLTQQLLTAVCGTDPGRWHEAADGARRALVSRWALWDGVLAAMHGARVGHVRPIAV